MKIWTAFKLGLIGAMTTVMIFHWQVIEAQAETPPDAIWITTEQTVAPDQGIMFAEQIPDGHWKDLGTFRTTGFCNCKRCCGKWAGGKTASGVYPVEGETIAVDPKVIPLGSMVMVDGHIYWAQDTGSGIKGNRIDVYYEDHNRAWNHGVKHQRVFIWKEDK